MKDKYKTKAQLINELSDLRRRVAEFEKAEIQHTEAEKAIKEGEQRLGNIIQGSPIPAFVIGKDHRVIYWNKALEVYSGIKAEDVIGSNQHWRAFYNRERPCMSDLIIDGEIEKIPQWYTGKYSRSQVIDGAFEATDFFPDMRDGTWLYFTAALIHNADGEMIGAIETLIDITKRKQSEHALQESRRQLSDIIGFLPDATIVIDRDGETIAWNRATEIMTGVKSGDMLGKGNYEYAIPFYGGRRPILIDLALHPDPEREKQYTTIRRTGDILFGESYTPKVGPR
jgi:PAS domain S-box-containing protein